MVSSVLPASTLSPGSKLIRRIRPLSGAETTYFSRIRVLPSSSTVTLTVPRSTLARSTSTGCGTNAYPSAATIAAKRSRTNNLLPRFLIPSQYASTGSKDLADRTIGYRILSVLFTLSTFLLLSRLQHRDQIQLVQLPSDEKRRTDRRGQHCAGCQSVRPVGNHKRKAKHLLIQ